ncbi:DUF3871 family protein [Niabella drilacis]|uniref:DUF3871 family protein n=1 Tax=Niabella drilacis (strain DSM 25811 / CCM 8410 / CCUG 62505 / LMG 26954 / E90) TaxID=1285928 RepID=A0A1G7AIW0_NIADE|nr:DUF3871 family protein [Niabella drilacis]SDE13806.1 protein of unknown function [Niabella drilacis]
MELQLIPQITDQDNISFDSDQSRNKSKSFIEANTKEVSLTHLANDCIIPVFSKDNETTISHHQFVETVFEAIKMVFPMESISEPELRISHDIRGRIPEAIGKPAKELLEHEKTTYYERMAFIYEVKSITNIINGNELILSIGGVRAYNQENLYSKKTMEKFKVFIGFQNQVCCNMCISTDGYAEEVRASSTDELLSKVVPLFLDFNANAMLTKLDSFADYELTQRQFCQFIGKAKLYHYLPKKEKTAIPYLAMNDGQLGAIAKAYFEDKNFASNSNGNIDLWKMYNLFTGAVKSSYIDNFVERTVNSYQLTEGFIQALNGHEGYSWFLE